MTKPDDIERLKLEYLEREKRLSGVDRYSLFNNANLFIVQQRQRAMLHLLRKHGFYPLERHRILELGCGSGGVLLELLSYGALPNLMNGVDLLRWRLDGAHSRLPHISLVCADGRCLPYPSENFDLILQFTVFSSILDSQIRKLVANEMRRVLKPNGMIIWYDFWLNPTNSHTRAIRPVEIRQLFPACDFDFHRITLAPPIVRRVANLSWIFCYMLENLLVLNTHYLTAIRPLG